MIDDTLLDALTELVNTGVGRAAKLLSDMTNTHIQLSAPEVRLLDSRSLQAEGLMPATDQVASVFLGFRGELSGTAALAFPLRRSCR